MQITGKETDNVLGCLAASVPWLYGLHEGVDDGGGNKDLRFVTLFQLVKLFSMKSKFRSLIVYRHPLIFRVRDQL